MPEPINTITSRTITLPQENIDTDQIIPARFLTTTTRSGLGAAAFHDWRYQENGEAISNTPFREEDRASHKILVAGANFGCGSSREHAPWALLDFEFKVVISTKIADIFKGNALKNGLLPVEIDPDTHRYLIENPGMELIVDLANLSVSSPNGGVSANFAVEPFSRRCLLDGVDPMGHLLNQDAKIAAYEARRVTYS